MVQNRDMENEWVMKWSKRGSVNIPLMKRLSFTNISYKLF
jgi:hypothetical protein